MYLNFRADLNYCHISTVPYVQDGMTVYYVRRDPLFILKISYCISVVKCNKIQFLIKYIFKIGEPECTKLSFKGKTGQIQNYKEIIESNSPTAPFQDPEFPHDMSSVGDFDLFDTTSVNYKALVTNGWEGKVEWMRIQVIGNYLKI